MHASCTPSQVFVVNSVADFASLQTYLDSLGYTAGVSELATRTDDAKRLTITVTYPVWALEG